MTQPMSVSQKNRSFEPTSKKKAASWPIFICSPPWVSTTPLGLPVVPDV